MSYVFTFGHGHVSPIDGSPQGDRFVESPDGLDSIESRAWVNRLWGRNWSFQYDTLDGAGVEEYGLRRAAIPDPDLIPDLDVRNALGARYWDAKHWRDAARSGRQSLLTDDDPLVVADRLYRGEMG